MSRKKYSGIMILVILISIFMIGIGTAGSIINFSSLSTFGESSSQVSECKDSNSVCVGHYTNVQCRAQGEETVFESNEIKDNNYHFIKCGYGEIDGNSISAYVKQCNFDIDIVQESVLTTDAVGVYICSNSFSVGDPAKSSSCTKQEKLGLSRETGYKQVGNGLSGDTNVGTLVVKGVSGTFRQQTTYRVKIRAQPYFLIRTGGDNFVSQDVSGCLLRPLLSKDEIIETQQNINTYQGEKYLAFNGVANWLWGYQSYRGVNLIKNYKNSDKDIYVNKPGQYYNVETTQEGLRIALVEKPVFSSDIECVPDEPSCDDKTAKRIQSTKDFKCSDFAGLDSDYIAKNDGTSCRYICENSKPIQKCVKTAECDGGERVDFASNKCVEVSKSSSKIIGKQENKFLWIPLAILLGGIILALIIFMIRKNQ